MATEESPSLGSNQSVRPSYSMSEPLSPSLIFFISNVHHLIPIKLDMHNYEMWKIQCEGALKASSLFEYVQQSEPLSPTITDPTGNSIPNPLYPKWVLADSFIHSCLISTLTPALLVQVEDFHTVPDLWKFLEQKFTPETTSVCNLRLKLISLQKLPNQSVGDFLQELRKVADQLADAGSPVSKTELLDHSIRGLPPDFDSIKPLLRGLSLDSEIQDIHSHIIFKCSKLEPKALPSTEFVSQMAKEASGGFQLSPCHLRLKLYTLEKLPNQSVGDFLQELRKIADQLGGAGSPVDNYELVYHSLRGLPPEFGSIKPVIRSVSLNSEIQEIHNRIVLECSKLETKSSTAYLSQMAKETCGGSQLSPGKFVSGNDQHSGNQSSVTPSQSTGAPSQPFRTTTLASWAPANQWNAASHLPSGLNTNKGFGASPNKECWGTGGFSVSTPNTGSDISPIAHGVQREIEKERNRKEISSEGTGRKHKHLADKEVSVEAMSGKETGFPRAEGCLGFAAFAASTTGATISNEPKPWFVDQTNSRFLKDSVALSFEERRGHHAPQGSGSIQRLPFQGSSGPQISQTTGLVSQMDKEAAGGFQLSPGKFVSGNDQHSGNQFRVTPSQSTGALSQPISVEPFQPAKSFNTTAMASWSPGLNSNKGFAASPNKECWGVAGGFSVSSPHTGFGISPVAHGVQRGIEKEKNGKDTSSEGIGREHRHLADMKGSTEAMPGKETGFPRAERCREFAGFAASTTGLTTSNELKLGVVDQENSRLLKDSAALSFEERKGHRAPQGSESLQRLPFQGFKGSSGPQIPQAKPETKAYVSGPKRKNLSPPTTGARNLSSFVWKRNNTTDIELEQHLRSKRHKVSELRTGKTVDPTGIVDVKIPNSQKKELEGQVCQVKQNDEFPSGKPEIGVVDGKSQGAKHDMCQIGTDIEQVMDEHKEQLQEPKENARTFLNAELKEAPSTIFNLRLKLISLQKLPNQSVRDFLQELRNIANQLADADSPVSKVELVYNSLRGLPPEFESIKPVVHSLSVHSDIEEIHNRIVSECSAIKSKASGSLQRLPFQGFQGSYGPQISQAKPEANLFGSETLLPPTNAAGYLSSFVSKKYRKHWTCAICRIDVPDTALHNHLQSKKHKAKTVELAVTADVKTPSSQKKEELNDGDIKKNEVLRKAKDGGKSCKLWCNLCELGTDIEKVMDDHKHGSEHKRGLEIQNIGKPKIYTYLQLAMEMAQIDQEKESQTGLASQENSRSEGIDKVMDDHKDGSEHRNRLEDSNGNAQSVFNAESKEAVEKEKEPEFVAKDDAPETQVVDGVCGAANRDTVENHLVDNEKVMDVDNNGKKPQGLIVEEPKVNAPSVTTAEVPDGKKTETTPRASNSRV